MPIPLPADRVKMGSEAAASAAACHVGAVIYDRMLRKNKEKAPKPDKETVSESFLQEIAEIEKEAKSLRSQ